MSSSYHAIVVDDSDARIQYSGSGWVPDNTGSQDGFGTYGPTYNHTLHTTQKNDSFAFSFQGSSVRVYGTVNLAPTYPHVSDSTFNPPWNCFIDQNNIGGSKPSAYHENNQLLCSSDILDDGPHELTLNISMVQGTNFWVDYVEYTPTQNVNDGSVVLVDHSDPSISYDSSWSTVDGVAGATSTKGGKVTVPFNGTQLSWVGCIPIEYPGNSSSATYSIDNGSPTTFSLVGHAATDGTSIFNEVFFTTPVLSPGAHTLTVTYNGNSNFTPLTLAYIYLTSSAGSSTSSSPGSSSSGTSSPSGSSGHHHTPVGAIVGGVVGGVVAIAILITLFICWRRRSKRTQAYASDSIPPAEAAVAVVTTNVNPEPYPISPVIRTFVGPDQSLTSSESLIQTFSGSPIDSRTISDAATAQTATTPTSLGSGFVSGAMARYGDAKLQRAAMMSSTEPASTPSHPYFGADVPPTYSESL